MCLVKAAAIALGKSSLSSLFNLEHAIWKLNVNQFVASRKDILMPKSNVLALENGPEDDDLLRLAVVTQTINVLYTTLLVLEEEEPTDPVVDGNDENKSKSSSVTSQKKRKKTGSSGKGFG